MIANISDIRPSVVAALGRCARSLGFESVTLLAPWFFPVAQADLVEFFVRGAEAASLPLFLYNFPERTGNRIALETIDAVAGRVEVAGVKQSGDEFEYHKDLVALGRARGFVVFTGGEPRLGEAMRLGVAGCVSGLANAVPELVAGLYTAVKAGDSSAETLATERIRRLCAELDRLQFPLNVAAAIEARGLAAGVPKSAISSATCQQYRLLAADLRGLYRQWQML
jgi:4-hydroxy-tetrahydrodipicolinate synthase